MFLNLLKHIAESPWLMISAVVVQIVCTFVMVHFKAQLMALPGIGPPPDLRFGYTPQELNDWYDTLGNEGCQLYKNMYRWDLFPFMESYALLLGAVTYRVAEDAGVSTQWAMIFPITMWLDVLETVIPAQGCEMYPERLPDRFIQIAIGANMLKWICFVCGVAILSALFLYTTVRPSQRKPKKD